MKLYDTEEETFVKKVSVVAKDDISADANVSNTHVMYNIKQKDEGSLKLKARVAPHGNGHDMKLMLASDCSTCPLTGLRIVESIAFLHGWKLYKADLKAAFLQAEGA